MNQLSETQAVKQLLGEPNWQFLHDVIASIKNLDKKDMMQVVKEIYEATYFKYAIMYHEAKAQRELYEQKVVNKVTENSQLQAEIAKLEFILTQTGNANLIDNEAWLKQEGFQGLSARELLQRDREESAQANS